MRQPTLRVLTLGLVIACGVGVCVAPAASGEGTATLYRDTWGVPHVYADSLAEATYALGYAQAQDRLDDIYRNVRTALGRMAEAFGPEHVEMDYVLRMVRNGQTCREYWETAPEHIRTACDSFVAGVEAYAAEHPDRKPEFALKLEGWHCAAIGRAMILEWPLGTLMDDLNNRDEAPGFGSNGFCVAPSRSAQGCAIHMTDPHLTWEGLAVFYEARLHAGDIHHSGFYLAGTPLLALGHNAHVAWACTTGGPDTSDVYMVRLNPKNILQYDYFGEWKTFGTQVITIDVKDGTSVVRPAFYTEYGPLLETGVIRLLTLAPEIPGNESLIREALARGVALAMGHTQATYDQVCTAVDLGVTQVTHLFNGMNPLHHRAPGAVGAALTTDALYCQLIADNIHLHPTVLDLTVRAKGPERVILVTDAMSGTGMPDGEYMLGGLAVTVVQGSARIASGNLAGSTLTMERAIRNMMAATGRSLQAVLPMATRVPAQALGLTRKGSIGAGMDADMVALDVAGNVAMTMVGGEIVYSAADSARERLTA